MLFSQTVLFKSFLQVFASQSVESSWMIIQEFSTGNSLYYHHLSSFVVFDMWIGMNFLHKRRKFTVSLHSGIHYQTLFLAEDNKPITVTLLKEINSWCDESKEYILEFVPLCTVSQFNRSRRTYSSVDLFIFLLSKACKYSKSKLEKSSLDKPMLNH